MYEAVRIETYGVSHSDSLRILFIANDPARSDTALMLPMSVWLSRFSIVYLIFAGIFGDAKNRIVSNLARAYAFNVLF